MPEAPPDKKKVELPAGYELKENGNLVLDPAVLYPPIQEELDVKKLDQFWLEVIYQFAKMDAQVLVKTLKIDPRPAKALVLIIRGNADVKNKWALKNYPEGRGVEAAAKGREARKLYAKVRGFIPQ